jgi:hypothetical protein
VFGSTAQCPDEDFPHVSTVSNGLVRIGRLLCRPTVVLAILIVAGCASPGSLKTSSLSLGGNAKDQSLRKRAEADPFPTAKQAGL